MPKRIRDCVTGFFIVALIASSPIRAEMQNSLSARLSAASRGGDYRPALPDELAASEKLLASLLAADNETARNLASPLGVTLHHASDPQALVLVEAKGAQFGRPVVAVRNAGVPVMLQMPHSFKDEMTREIGLRLFHESQARVAMWNTVPRHYERFGVEVDADMAHLPQTWFTAMTTAFARDFPAGRIVQLHGFDAAKRKSRSGATAEFVISNGTANPGPMLREAVTCLARGLGAEVRLYPDTVRELGGTTNAQVAALRGQGYQGFIHVEIGRPMRERLLADAAARRTFADCLINARGNS